LFENILKYLFYFFKFIFNISILKKLKNSWNDKHLLRICKCIWVKRYNDFFSKYIIFLKYKLHLQKYIFFIRFYKKIIIKSPSNQTLPSLLLHRGQKPIKLASSSYLFFILLTSFCNILRKKNQTRCLLEALF
jgi:hypothetical protein